jgi:hypothetical protein
VGETGHTYYFRTRPWDMAGNVGAYTDGTLSRAVNTCSVSADAYESDNSSASAHNVIPNAGAQTHNFHVEQDNDWLAFTAFAGMTYTIATANTGGHADTVVELYDSSGSTLLAVNDDDPDNWPASRLEWVAPSTGNYLLRVYHWEPTGAGCTTAYGIAITAPLQQVFLPFIQR